MKIHSIISSRNIRNIGIAAATAATILTAAPKANAQDEEYKEPVKHVFNNQYWVTREDFDRLAIPIQRRQIMIESHNESLIEYQEKRDLYLDSLDMLKSDEDYNQLKAANEQLRLRLETIEKNTDKEITELQKAGQYYSDLLYDYKSDHNSKGLNYFIFGALGAITGALLGLFRSNSKK